MVFDSQLTCNLAAAYLNLICNSLDFPLQVTFDRKSTQSKLGIIVMSMSDVIKSASMYDDDGDDDDDDDDDDNATCHLDDDDDDDDDDVLVSSGSLPAT